MVLLQVDSTQRLPKRDSVTPLTAGGNAVYTDSTVDFQAFEINEIEDSDENPEQSETEESSSRVTSIWDCEEINKDNRLKYRYTGDLSPMSGLNLISGSSEPMVH